MQRLFILIVLFSCTKIAVAQFPNKNWSAGAYYDTKGVKHQGLLTWIAPDQDTLGMESIIYFKDSAQLDATKIPVQDVKSFVIKRYNVGDIDSFVVSKNPLLSHKPILTVLVYKNTIKLYNSITFAASKAFIKPNGKTITSSKSVQLAYYFGPDDLHLSLLDEHNFQEMIPVIMADRPEIVAQIRNKRLAFKDMLTILYAYRYNSLPPASTPAPSKKG